MAEAGDRDDDGGKVIALMKRSQEGDRAAFAELQAFGKARGRTYIEKWSESLLLFRLQDRVSPKNLLARASVEDQLAKTVAELSNPSDGPIERLIVKRAALCVVDAGLADVEHIGGVTHLTASTAEALDRRRDRAHRRLLSTLKALAAVRRMNRPVVQVNVGDGNVNVVKA